MGVKTGRFLIPVIGILIVLAAAAVLSSLTARPADKGFRVSAEEAKKIALADSGENGDQVTFTRIKAEQEGKSSFYKTEFYTDIHEYKYEIDADSGQILNKESSTYHNVKEGQRESGSVVSGPAAGQPEQKDNDSLIGVKKAQQIALDSAGLKENEAVFEKSRLGTEDGKVIYEIDFSGGRAEYEFDIDAYDGTVLEREIKELIPAGSKKSVEDDDDAYADSEDDDNEDDDEEDDEDDDNDDEDDDDDEEEEDADDD